jgi:hypothetical protein
LKIKDIKQKIVIKRKYYFSDIFLDCKLWLHVIWWTKPAKAWLFSSFKKLPTTKENIIKLKREIKSCSTKPKLNHLLILTCICLQWLLKNQQVSAWPCVYLLDFFVGFWSLGRCSVVLNSILPYSFVVLIYGVDKKNCTLITLFHSFPIS